MIEIALGLGGPTDIAIIAVVILLLFGGSKIADFGKSLGRGIKEFKQEASSSEEARDTPVPSNGSNNAE